ncbi:TonB-dependent receptor [Sphingomonas jatrophae]|uniref:Iron complex outermembrane recepter protein n=1 Tax=Sphingomonas jatrophae TaxID=1166337 RepID=A0A1I6K8I3_9SPHN|nr:TonB-dependent receptor [Sphingomonas jatrophae]SFR87529.1 iron complex outermembrane recepter protein [Sphingomonas jatrophae]
MKRLSKLACAAMPFVVAAAPAAAQETGGSTVVITGITTAPATLAPLVGKTGTPLADLPRSVQLVPRELIDQQGGVLLRDALRNVSGLAEGGNYAFGFYDRFTARGLNLSFLTDGLPDTTSDLGGYIHSLNGVERVEVLKGPGSALFGAAQPGGSINLVRYRPGDTLSGAISTQYGSFDTTTTNASINVPLSSTVSARVDGEFLDSDGYRGLHNQTAEVYGSLGFRPAGHDILLRLEYHDLEATPDAIGLPFSPPAGSGLPAAVDKENRYYTPFAFADQRIKRAFLSDAWAVNDSLVVNLRTAYTDRDVDLARNAGGRLTAIGTSFGLTGRQLRAQTDEIHDFVVQAEPTWQFDAGSMPVRLLVGGELRRIDATTRRATADLPNITNIFAPVTPETTLGSLTFLCNATHSCNDAKLEARFYGVYGIGQIGLTDRLKLRLSARQDWFKTSAEGRSAIPRNPGSEHVCSPPQATTCAFVPGDPVVRKDDRFSWDVGVVYQLADAFSLFGGYSSSNYPIFNTEEPQSVGQVPEKGTQVEAGVRVTPGDWLAFSSAVYRTTRKNVFTILAVPDPAGTGNLSTAQVYSYRTKGWENDLTLRPLPAWTLTGNFTLQDPELTDYPQTPALVGNRVPSVPKRIANVWTTYAIALPGDGDRIELSGGARYRSAYWGDAAQTRKLPGATQVDAAAALIVDRFTVRAGVQNIFDKTNYRYAAGVGSGAVPGPGRTFFVSAAVRAF